MRNVIKRNQVEVDEAAREHTSRAPASPHAGASLAGGGARVRLLQVDAEKQVLEFTCACGEVSLIEVQCEKPS
jgi:hypothetical protein